MLTEFNALLGEKQIGMLIPARWGYHPYCEKKKIDFLQYDGLGLRPPRTADLAPCFVLCGFIKQKVYCNKPCSLEDLKHNNKQAAVRIA
jgi:hypothetical protein